METVWRLDHLGSIGGHRTELLGNPRLVEGPEGKAIEFDGGQDGLIVDAHSLVGAETFTVEVVFQPYARGLAEQRFVHLQESSGDNRVLIETRLTDDEQWFLDTFVKSDEGDQTLFAEDFKHPIGPWYQAAMVFDGREMRHYVNGRLELAGRMGFAPLRSGQTSIGVRLNRVYWFKGGVSTVRFAARALSADEFLQV